jgi:hypothetical protein
MMRERPRKPRVWDDEFLSQTIQRFKNSIPGGYFVRRQRDLFRPCLGDFAGNCARILAVECGAINGPQGIQMTFYFGYPNEHIVWHDFRGISGYLRPRGVRKYGDLLNEVMLGIPYEFDHPLRPFSFMESAVEFRRTIVNWAEKNSYSNDKKRGINHRWFGSDLHNRGCDMYLLKDLEVNDEERHS